MPQPLNWPSPPSFSAHRASRSVDSGLLTAKSESIGVLWTKDAMSLISGSYSLGLTASTGPAADCILLIVLKAVVLTAALLKAGIELRTEVERRGAVKRVAAGRAARRVRLIADMSLNTSNEVIK